MKHFSKERIFSVSYDQFLPYLKKFYLNEVVSPKRPHYSIPGKPDDGTLLLMPAWQYEGFIGTKIITVFPGNAKKDLPSIQGIYLLFQGESGELLATFDGPSLTTVRTAAVSGLASSILARPDIESLLMIGTGQLCHHLIRAHASWSNIENVFIWGRNFQSSQEKAFSLALPHLKVQAIKNKDEMMGKVDLISCATFSPEPLVYGNNMKNGSHLDLVGSYTPTMREADDACLLGAKIFVDDFNALEESGDLAIPINTNIIEAKDVLGDLKALCKNGHQRLTKLERTVFKSVGNAKSDLALASFLMSNFE